MKTHNISGLLAVALGLMGATVGAAERWWSVRDDVTNECVVAVPLTPVLYERGPHVEEGTLRAAFRVRDGAGGFVPYVVRPRQRRVVEVRQEWTQLKIVSVSETNAQLHVEVLWPMGVKPSKSFSRLRVSTPLSDFEQSLDVFDGERKLATGRLCDYSRYASFRRNEMTLGTPFTRRLKLVFSNPTSAREQESFERMIRSNGDGSVNATEVRRGVQMRPFRIDGVSVAFDRRYSTFRPTEPAVVKVAASGREEGTSTVFIFDSCRLPTTGLRLNVTGRNFSRRVKVERRLGHGWREVALGKVAVIDLPGERVRRVDVPFAQEIREGLLRVTVENGDSGPLVYEIEPISLLSPRYDVAFIAKPGERYEVGFIEKGTVPHFDEIVRDYIDRVRDPVVLTVDVPGFEYVLRGTDLKSFSGLREAALTIVFVAAFAVLLMVCLSLFRGKSKMG